MDHSADQGDRSAQVNNPQAEALGMYAARRHAGLVSHGAGLYTRNDHLIAGFTASAIAAEFAWMILAFMLRLRAISGWSIAAAILVMLFVAYRLISARRLS
jgi:hypothetical protein